MSPNDQPDASGQRVPSGMEIAVIGMAGRFPGARDTDELWDNLRAGVESIRRFTPEELEAWGAEPSLVRDPNFVPYHAAMDDVEMFDAAFFGFNQREAEVLNPQHRWFLEVAWEALEKAGYDPGRARGAIGVFGGSHANFYLHRNVQRNPRVFNSVGHYGAILSNLPDGLAPRVSYKLDLRGPSVAVQCACSTSLVAIHLACQSLLAGECDMALAGGSTVIVPQGRGYLYQEGMILSPDGHCRAFDARAKGTVTGDGVGIVVLKRLADALADRDTVRAVILASAANNDGSDKIGYTAPGLGGQRRAVEEAQHLAGIHPESVTYIEAHGTGTALGDPIEVTALTQAFRTRTQKRGYCGIGSVKTNFGHLDAAAGVTSFIKTVLALEHREIPPTLHFETSNPEIDFAASPFYVATELRPWESPAEEPRRAGVSAFGMGGTNAHIVLEEAPAPIGRPSRRDTHLLLLSARSEGALAQAGERLAAHLAAAPATGLADVAWTLQVGRRAFAHRRIAVARDAAEAAAVLGGSDPRRTAAAVAPKEPPPVVFLFPGQGAQYPDMGLGLYRREEAFRREVDGCAELLVPHLGFDLRRVLFPPPGDAAAAAERLKQTAVAQPALFVTHYALARLWMDLGVEPAAMIGHSIGEYAAACLAGVLSLADALQLVAARGRLMQSLPPGSMLVVPLPEEEAERFLTDSGTAEELSLAAFNAPQLAVASGPAGAVARLAEALAQRGLEGRVLETSHAFHSAMMDPILEPFARLLAGVRLAPPERPYVSTVTGDWIRAEEATSPAHWLANIRRPVRFAAGAGALLAEANRVFLEVGPGTTLGSLVRLHPQKGPGHTVLSSLRHPLDPEPDEAALLAALGKLWAAGARVDPARLYAGEERRRVPLPAYPFERRRCWVLPQEGADQTVLVKGVPRKAASRQGPDEWYWRPGWRSVLAPSLPRDGAAAPALVLHDGSALGEALAARLRAHGHPVREAVPGDGFRRAGDVFTLDPRERAHYGELLDALAAAGEPPALIAHLWLAGEPPAGPVDLPRVMAAEERGFYSLLELARALGERGLATPVRLRIATRGMQAVLGGDGRAPERATVAGACRVIPQEFPNLDCAAVDLEAGPGAPDEAWTAERLAAELLAGGSDPVVAYRGRQRWVEDFEPVRLAPDPVGSRLRRRGVYLITGGTGGLGLAIAEHLASAVEARLVLAARTPLPPRADWEGWLASHDAGDPTSRRIQTVRMLEERGAEVLVAAADVTDEAAMTALLAAARARFGALHGVIHAAGVVGDHPLRAFERAAIERVLAPKIHGAVVLSRALAGEPLDFFVVMSSMSSLLGGLGQADYCAANSFLDAFAHSGNGAPGGRLVAAANWDAWSEVGMAARYAEEKGSENRTNWISPEDGCQALERILAHDLPQVIVTKNDFQLVRQQFADLILGAAARPREEAAAGAPAAGAGRAGIATEYVPPATPAEEAIARIWSDLLAIEPVGSRDDFFELGGHSLLATQVVARLKERFGVELLLKEVLEAPTVGGLGELVDRKRLAHEVAEGEGEREEIEV